MDLGSNSDDETKITTMGLKGKAPNSNISFDSCASTSKVNDVSEDKKRNELFHLRVVAKNIKIDAIIDSGSQVNLISEDVVRNLGLKTTQHKKPYPLGWICENDKLQVTRQCTLKFVITSKFVDEVQFDVVPLDICGIVLGSPYLYDWKAIFYREKNHYHLFKDGIQYIVHSHKIKTGRSFTNTGQFKRVINASKDLTLMSINKGDSR